MSSIRVSHAAATRYTYLGGDISAATHGAAAAAPCTRLTDLRALLTGHRDASSEILNVIAASGSLSSRLAVVETAHQAVALYDAAAAIPRSVTRLAMSKAGLLLDGPFEPPGGHSPSRHTFMFSFQAAETGRLIPRVVKLFESMSCAEDEASLWRELGSEATAACIGLVPLVVCTIPRRIGPPKGGLLLPHFPCTLSQVPGSVTAVSALDVIRQISPVLDFIHARGWWHGDVKPSNVFMDAAGDLFLGDYGTSVKYAVGAPATARFDGGNAGTPAFQCASMQPGDPAFSPLLFDRTSLAISVLIVVGALRIVDSPDWPGWSRTRLRSAADSISHMGLCTAVKLLLPVAGV